MDTGILRRDAHLRSEDFFDVAKFPDITFVSRRASPVGDQVLVTGDLSFHGVMREVTVPVKVRLDGEVLRARGELTIKMSEYGIHYRSFFNPVRDEVQILFDLRGLPDGKP